MYYKKLTVDGNIIEFHNNWLGEETVVANGTVMSKKSSVMGIDHHFSILEHGNMCRYVLTSKVDMNMSVYLDLVKNGNIVYEDIPVLAGTSPKKERKNIESPYKASGLQKLKMYDIEGAIEDLLNALDKNSKDPEIYFHLACAYSILEKPLDGYEALKKAIKYNLNNRDMILTHEMLSFIRIHNAFEEFVQSGYIEYDKSKF